jgi:hypothetical protein
MMLGWVRFEGSGAVPGCPHPRRLSRKRERGEFDRASAGLFHPSLVCTPSPTLFVGEGGTRVSAAG